MKRKALYSRTTRARQNVDRSATAADSQQDWFEENRGPSLALVAWQRSRAFTGRHPLATGAVAIAMFTLAALFGWQLAHPLPAALTQWDIDGAVKYTLDNTPPGPAETTVAAAVVSPSVVRVDGYFSPEHAAEIAKQEAIDARKAGKKPEAPAKPDPNAPPTTSPGQQADAKPHPDSVGTGVVISEQGDILTNLHVIRSTDRWVITFFDGSTSDAILVSAQPENDLAVIRAKRQPDDLKPATMASTRDLLPGDRVVAVGFPFGIGPSVSSGVVAGLKREFDDPTDKEKPKMTNLIQFDAAVNPGNSGGPLVNRDGEVVGIVTAIYNPTGQRVFAGMAFAVPIENAARGAMTQNPF
jgi:serine protease DegQ